MKAQTVWLGGQDSTNSGISANNIITNGANWVGGTVNLSSTSTELVFGDSADPLAYNLTPYLAAGTDQIGTLTITKTGGGSIFAGHGDGSLPGGLINGLNIYTAVNYNGSGSTNFTSIMTTGPVYLNGTNVTIGGSAIAGNTLELGAAPGGGGVGIITSNGNAITKTGAFELELAGNASGLGTVNLQGGILAVTPFGSGFISNVVSSAGTYFTIFPASGSTYTYSGQMSGAGSFYKTGWGTDGGSTANSTVVMTGSNSYTGTTIVNKGTLQVGADNTLPIATKLAMDPGTTLDVAHDQAIDHFYTYIDPNNSANNYDGTGSFITLGSSKTLSVNTASINTRSKYAGMISGAGALAINGVIDSGSPASSMTIITGSNSYGGGTTVNGGALVVNNSSGSGLGSGPVVVNSGGRLEGMGSFTGPLTLKAGAAIAPGKINGAGMLVAGGLAIGSIDAVNGLNSGSGSGYTTTLFGGANYIWLLGNATGAQGTDYSVLNLNGGALALDASATPSTPFKIKPVTFDPNTGIPSPISFTPSTAYQWNIITGASNPGAIDLSKFTVDPSAFQNLSYAGTFGLEVIGNSLVLDFTTTATAIPEPAAGAALAGALALAGAVWRRKKTRRV